MNNERNSLLVIGGEKLDQASGLGRMLAERGIKSISIELTPTHSVATIEGAGEDVTTVSKRKLKVKEPAVIEVEQTVAAKAAE